MNRSHRRGACCALVAESDQFGSVSGKRGTYDTPSRVPAAAPLARQDALMPVPAGTRQRYNPNPAGGRTPGIPRRIAVTGRFQIEEHERLHQAAAAADCTLSVLLSALINTIEFDEVGRPTLHGHLLMPAAHADQSQALPLAM